MKKTHRAGISIFSLIIILTFTGSAFAEDTCIIKTFGANWVKTNETSRTQQAAYEAYQLISYGDSPSWNGSSCYWGESMRMIGACEGYLDIYDVCLDGSYSYDTEYCELCVLGGFCTSIGGGGGGSWDVICGPDADGDNLPDSEDADTVYGTISGDVQEGVTVGIYRPNCGGDVLLETTTTDAAGYYSFGNLSNGFKTILPELSGYTFAPGTDYPKIPQAEIKSYDFTSTPVSP